MLLERKDGKSSAHRSPPPRTHIQTSRSAWFSSMNQVQPQSCCPYPEILSSPSGVDMGGPGATHPSASARIRGQPPLSPAG